MLTVLLWLLNLLQTLIISHSGLTSKLMSPARGSCYLFYFSSDICISNLKNEFILSSFVLLVHFEYRKHSISTPDVFGHNIIKVGNIFFLCRVLF